MFSLSNGDHDRFVHPAVWYRKNVRTEARRAVAGETITTVMADGHVETTNVAHEGDMVVRGVGGECYVVNGAKFSQRYEADPERPGVTDDGFAIYRFVGKPVPCIRLSRHEHTAFQAPWGETMSIKGGGVIVVGESNDVYGIQADEFAATYAPCTLGGTVIPPSDWKLAYARACEEAREDFHDFNLRRTQAEVESEASRYAQKRMANDEETVGTVTRRAMRP